MKGDVIYIQGIQKSEVDRIDNISVACGNEHTWSYKEIYISKAHCYSEKALRDKYAEEGLSAYSIDELLEEIKKRFDNPTEAV